MTTTDTDYRDQSMLLPDVLDRFGKLRCAPLVKRYWAERNDGFSTRELRDMPREEFERRETRLLDDLRGMTAYWESRPWLSSYLFALNLYGWGKDPDGLEALFEVIAYRVRLMLWGRTGKVHRDDALHIITAPLAPGFTDFEPNVPLELGHKALAPNVSLHPTNKTYYVFRRVMEAYGWPHYRGGTAQRINHFRCYPDQMTGNTLPLLEPSFDDQGRLLAFVAAEEYRDLDKIEARLREKLTAPEPWMQKHLIGRISFGRIYQMADPYNPEIKLNPVAAHRISAVLREFGFEEHPSHRGSSRSVVLRTDGRPLEKLGHVPMKLKVETNEPYIVWETVTEVGPLRSPMECGFIR